MVKPKHKIKRIYSAISFAAILVTLIFLLFSAIFGDDNTAKIISSSSGVIIMVLGCLTAIIGGYLGLSYHDDLINSKGDDS